MKPTPFYPRTSLLCDSYSWAEWSGWLTANTYDIDHTHEYIAIRTACAVFDSSPLYKYLIHGPDALKLMNRVVTQDVSRYAPAVVCTHHGAMMKAKSLTTVSWPDWKSRAFACRPQTLRFYWLEDNAIGLDVTIEEVTEALAVLALQGPYSRDLLKTLSDADFDQLPYFSITNTKLAGIPVTVSRTGYTGDLGYEIWVESHQAVQLWDALFEAGQAYRLRPFGEYALGMARIEAGLLLAEVDFHSSKKVLHEFQKSSPLELGLGWTVNTLIKSFSSASGL